MGAMADNMRAWWNDLGTKFSDPGKLAQLSVADMEKALRQAKSAAAPIIGRPKQLEAELKGLKSQDSDLTVKIKMMLKSDPTGESAKRHLERQVMVRKSISEREIAYKDASEASNGWLEKIRTLENELYNRRHKANSLQADYESAKAEEKLGKNMQMADTMASSDKFSTYEAMVNKKKASAAGYSAMSGLDDRVNEDRMLRDASVSDLLAEYAAEDTASAKEAETSNLLAEYQEN